MDMNQAGTGGRQPEESAAVPATPGPQSSVLSPQHSVELHIEQLVLHGFAPGDGGRIARAAERELARLFAEQGVPVGLDRGLEAADLDGGQFEMTSGTTAEEAGARIAQRIFAGFNR